MMRLFSFLMLLIMCSGLAFAITLADPNNVGLTIPGSTTLAPSNNVVLVIGVAVAAVDSCTYTSGNWDVDFADNCLITSNVDVGGNDITIKGFGNFTTYANITGYNFLDKLGNNSGHSFISELRGGGFK